MIQADGDSLPVARDDVPREFDHLPTSQARTIEKTNDLKNSIAW